MRPVSDSMTPKEILVTGATSGIGKATAQILAEEGHNIHILARNGVKARQLIDELKKINKNGVFTFVEADLSSLKSVDTAAHLINCRLNKLDVIINNAGGIFQSRQESADGYELTLAMNHLGPFHLTNQLVPLLEKGTDARIVNVSSGIHPRANINMSDFNLENSWSAMLSYANAKLYNIYSAQYWAEQLTDKDIQAFSLHPGVVNTGFANGFRGFMKIIWSLIKPLMISPKKGAATSVYLAVSDDVADYNGAYFEKCKVSNPSTLATDNNLREQVINESFKLIQKVIGNGKNAH